MNFLDESAKRRRMLVHQPIPGYWYTNVVGQLQQVRVVLHEAGQQTRVVLENITGRRHSVDLEGWYRLNLTLHSPGVNRRRRGPRSDHSEHSS